jgi:Mg-chelatase subunit ChlD
MADWFYRQKDKIVGPVTRQELDFLVSTGRVKSSTEVRSGAKGRWHTLAKTLTSQSGNKTVAQARASAASPSLEVADVVGATALQSEAMAPDNLTSQQAASADDPTKRQAVVGVVVAIMLLIGLWLMWDRVNEGGYPDGLGDQGIAGTEEEAGSGATPAETSKTASTAEQSNESTATTSIETETTAVDETQKGTAAAVPGSGSQMTDAASSSDTGNKQSQQQAASSDAAIPEKSQLATETISGQDATVPGDPLSKFTISAPGEATFFGLRASGRRFVFVVDRSGSMAGEPLQRAKEELMKCIRHLPQHVEVHVVFFDDLALPEPGGYRKLHRRNVESIQKWVDRISEGGGTNVNAGMKCVFSRRQLPDAIFLLTDGEFDTDTPQFVRQLNPDGNVTINTVALVSNGGEYLLKQIARENKGDYRFVP